MLKRNLQSRSQEALDRIVLPHGATRQEPIDDLLRQHVVFVSHTYPDAALIERFLLPALSENYFDYHFENAKTKNTEIYKPYINRSLNRCQWFLVCVSLNTLMSEWVRVEIEIAFQLKSTDRIVCIQLDDTEPISLDVRLKATAGFALTDDKLHNVHELVRILAS